MKTLCLILPVLIATGNRAVGAIKLRTVSGLLCHLLLGAILLSPAVVPVAYADAFGGTPIWRPTGSMPVGKNSHVAVRLPNGKVLVMGGNNGSASLNSAALYDPVAGTWTAAGTMSGARHAFAAILLPNGKVLAMGGWNGSAAMNSAELYDPATDTWANTGNL
ncbi:MAG TPA: kelch repeat-containing protein, partial [Verrucomicrobiae bacterium]